MEYSPGPRRFSPAGEFGKCLPGASQVVLVMKNLPANAGDVRGAGSIPGSGRPPRGGGSNPLQHSCLESPLDRGAWRATVHGVAKSQTRLKRPSTHAPDEQISESHTRAQSQGHLSNVRGRVQVDSGARHKDLPPNPGSSGSRAALSRRTGSCRPPQNAVPTR